MAVPYPLSDSTIIFCFRSFSRTIRPLLLLVASGWLWASEAAAQGVTPVRRPPSNVPADVRRPPQILRADTVRTAPTRTPARRAAADTVGLVRRTGTSPDSVRVAAGGRKGSVETTVKYAAKDSIRFNVQEKKAILYDKASVDYGELNLKAAQITVDYSQNLLTAEGAKDSTGKVSGRPVFKNGSETYQAGRINYNFKTRKGKIAEAVTQQGEGFVHAEVIKKNEINEIYGRNGRYTTCNLEHPHFFINASKIKVIPGEKVVTGPFNLVIGDIPTPLGFLFGYFPSPSSTRASGLIIPTFGQSADRGFFLRNGGYYWAANDNIGVRLTGDIYSGNAQQFGGWRGTAEMQYLKRYRYNGLFSFNYSSQPNERILAPEGANTNPAFNQARSARNFQLAWSHSPVPRPNGGRFSANVNVSSNNYFRQNSYDPRQFLTPAFQSNISYSKQLRDLPINYSVNLSQSQNTQTGSMDFTLPDVTVGLARQYPYQWLGLTQQGKFYEQFAFSYTMTAQNRISNTRAAQQLEGGLPLIGGTTTSGIIPVNFNNLRPLLRNSQNGVNHQFQISLGNYPLFKYLNFTPAVSYSQLWYFKSLEYSYNRVAQAIRVDTVAGFNALHNVSGGASLNTTIYGLWSVKGKKVEAIRHKITPSLNYQVAPAASERLYNRPDLPLGTLRDAQGRLYDNRQYAFSRFQGFVYGIPNGQRQSQVSFSLQNAVEMKVRNTNDTTGTTPFEKVSLIDGLDFNLGYNFLADSLRLTPLSSTFRTQVAKKLNILLSATFDFYQRDTTGRTINRYLFDQPGNRRLTRLTNAALQLTYQFNPAQKPQRKSNIPREVAPTNDPVLGAPRVINPYEDYVDFELPWELNANFTAQYTDPGPRPTRLGYIRPRSLAAASLNMSGSLKLTNNLRVGYSTGYDFISQQVSFTSLDIFRDLHCWQITGNWRPFGFTKGYFVTIAAKSSLLQDLKLNRNRTFLNQ